MTPPVRPEQPNRPAQNLSAVNVNPPYNPLVPTLDEFLSYVKVNNLARQERFFTEISCPVGLEFSNVQQRNFGLLCEQAALPGKNITTKTVRINGLDERRAAGVDYMGDNITLQFLIDKDYNPKKMIDEWMDYCVTGYGARSYLSGESVRGRNEIEYYNDYIGTIHLIALMPAGLPGEALTSWSPTQGDLGIREGINNIRNGESGIRNVAAAGLNKLMGRGVKALDRGLSNIKTKLGSRLGKDGLAALEAIRDTERPVYGIKLHEAFPVSLNMMPVGYDNVGVQRMNVTFCYKYWTAIPFNDTRFGANFVKGINNKLNNLLKK